MKDVPYIAFEAEMSRLERVIKRMYILIILAVVLLVSTNAYWIYYESQFEEVVTTTQEVTQENEDGVNNFIGNDGEITNGETESENNNH